MHDFRSQSIECLADWQSFWSRTHSRWCRVRVPDSFFENDSRLIRPPFHHSSQERHSFDRGKLAHYGKQHHRHPTLWLRRCSGGIGRVQIGLLRLLKYIVLFYFGPPWLTFYVLDLDAPEKLERLDMLHLKTMESLREQSQPLLFLLLVGTKPCPYSCSPQTFPRELSFCAQHPKRAAEVERESVPTCLSLAFC